MRLKNIISLTAIFLVCSYLYAQPSLDTLLILVNKDNSMLITAQSLLETRKLDARTGLTPSNPEVEFGYMWGNPVDIGNKIDFAITQSFDFPTAYSSRSKLAKINRQQAELEYKATRQAIYLKARQVWIEQVYLNKVESFYTGRLDYALTVFKGFERKLETGEANRLQLNQARMKVMALENEVSLLRREFSKNKAEILSLTGNYELRILDTIFPASVPIIFDSILLQYKESYLNRLYQVEIEKKAKEVDVVFNQKLPKLKAGYYSESILNTKLQGIQAGITIPLWGNARAVNTAKANLAYAEADAEGYWQHQQNKLKNMYEQWVYLHERVTDLDQMLAVANDEALLRRAMDAGEISLTEYFYESDFYFQNIINLLQFKKEMFLLEAELRKVYY